MMTRREVNRAATLAVAALFFQGPATLLEAAGPIDQRNPKDRMRNMASAGVQTLMQEPLAEMPHPEVTVITLTVAPGANSAPHRHTGPVFAYLLEGEIENQVDPNPPRTYKTGEFFYEPPMHIHRSLRNLSSTKPAKLLIFEVGEKGKPFTIAAS